MLAKTPMMVYSNTTSEIDVAIIINLLSKSKVTWSRLTRVTRKLVIFNNVSMTNEYFVDRDEVNGK